MESILIISSMLLWVVVLLNLLLTLGLARRIRNANFPVMESLKVGQKAPDFSAPTLQGQTVTLADYAGRTAAFVFVSPDCKPCREEFPRLRELLPNARGFGTELVLVSDGDEEKTRSLVNGLAVELPVLVAPREHNPFFFRLQSDGHTLFLPDRRQRKGTGGGNRRDRTDGEDQGARFDP